MCHDGSLGRAWRSQIEMVDDDLGRSAAGGVARAGFERMVTEVCLGKVAAVTAREVSREGRTPNRGKFACRFTAAPLGGILLGAGHNRRSLSHAKIASSTPAFNSDRAR